MRPSRTRNGSATSSTVCGSSPTDTASVDSPTGPPPKRVHSAPQYRAVQAVEAAFVHLVDLERRARGVQVALAVCRGPGPSPAPAAAGGWRCAGYLATATRSRLRPRRPKSKPSNWADRVTMLREVRRLIEVEVRGEAEAIP